MAKYKHSNVIHITIVSVNEFEETDITSKLPPLRSSPEGILTPILYDSQPTPRSYYPQFPADTEILLAESFPKRHLATLVQLLECT